MSAIQGSGDPDEELVLEELVLDELEPELDEPVLEELVLDPVVDELVVEELVLLELESPPPPQADKMITNKTQVKLRRPGCNLRAANIFAGAGTRSKKNTCY